MDSGLSNLPKDIWLMKPCEVYKEEHNDCKKILSRFYQYYVDGAKTDCSQWLMDFKNCMIFRKTRDTKAMDAVLSSERKRRAERLQRARDNNVWEYRTSPPPEWFSPLSSESACR
ncbi:hypothetical protein EGW08_009861 [Elysia chlorotica]|uniref:Synaptic plasticity regulator PANTS n=1 Tax=Elysia chlorotica TaxID=188477 RepID=A0A3S1A497_ELYCH|nr:hypothetical protein EGW08_009861 [Elysia chlorotica]